MDKIDITMQKFVSQPTFEGYFEVARWDEVQKKYVPIAKEVYKIEQKAIDRARQLNEDNKEEENKKNN